MHSIKRQAIATVIRGMASVRKPILKKIHRSGDGYCPLCDSNTLRFLPFGNPPRENARCPICNSLERTRLDWLLFKRKTDLFDGKRKNLLHIAPEESLAAQFRKIDNLEYLSADLNCPLAGVRMDITNIVYPDNSFSAIYCSHVLEHVEDDRKAISELFRVLRPNGWAVIQVPITVETTYEDFSIIDPDERARHFGQVDHVRRCGPDYIERLKDAGFVAELLRGRDIATEADCKTMAIQPNRIIFFCQKNPDTI